MNIHAAPKLLTQSLVTPTSSRDVTCGREGQMSSRKFSGNSSKAEKLAYRSAFKARWHRFIHKHFQSPEHAAFTFGVDATTAKNWWEGSNAPSGFAVGMAYEKFPAEAAQSLTERNPNGEAA